MTTRYRVEYALKQHRRDNFIEWIKNLAATPFVLHAGTSSLFLAGEAERASSDARRKYAEVFSDVERLIADQVRTSNNGGDISNARINKLVPTLGRFFTELPLERAFYVVDSLRAISKRRMVAPSFNDIRLILNTAQAMALSLPGEQRVQLVTFDGDVTLYEDGQSLEAGNPINDCIINFMKRGIYIGIVTAAGYSDPSGEMYYTRLRGLVDTLVEDKSLSPETRKRLLIMGGECHYMFQLDGIEPKFHPIAKEEWAVPEMLSWAESDMRGILDRAEAILSSQKHHLGLYHARVYRKERSVGLIPTGSEPISREALEEVVLNCQVELQRSPEAQRLYFCAFNGGSDVWVDVGDKRYGVFALQKYLGDIPFNRTLHVGDQFASLGANDFKARLAACTVWIANPQETMSVVRELIQYLDEASL